MTGNWDEALKLLGPANPVRPTPMLKPTAPGRPATQPSAQDQAADDLQYIRKAIAQGRPAWWAHCKAGEKTPLVAEIWNGRFSGRYDPAGKTSLQLSIAGSSRSFTLAWPPADMDNPTQAEHGFSRGELIDLQVWNTLGMAAAWTEVPLATQINATEKDRAALSQYLDFRGDLAGVYYGNPRARRWGLWLYLAMYMDKYAPMSNRNSREAVGVAFLARSWRTARSTPPSNCRNPSPLKGRKKRWPRPPAAGSKNTPSPSRKTAPFAKRSCRSPSQTGCLS